MVSKFDEGISDGIVARIGVWIMFVQVIEGKVSDKAGLRRQMDRWEAEIRRELPASSAAPAV